MLLFVTSLIVCVVCHELSHLIAAKYAKCGVDVFSVGFGPPILKKKFGNTVYQIAPILLGGFCKLKGELDATRAKGAFVNLKYIDKFGIIIAGCYCNIAMGLLAWLLCFPLHSYALYYFAVISTLLGLSNLLPIPALDGGYLVYFPLFVKLWGKEKGIRRFKIVTTYGFIILMMLNILCIPFLYKQIVAGRL